MPGEVSPWRIFDAEVGEDSLAIARTLASAQARASPFYGLIFALVADRSTVRLYQPIPGFLGTCTSLRGALTR